MASYILHLWKFSINSLCLLKLLNHLHIPCFILMCQCTKNIYDFLIACQLCHKIYSNSFRCGYLIPSKVVSCSIMHNPGSKMKDTKMLKKDNAKDITMHRHYEMAAKHWILFYYSGDTQTSMPFLRSYFRFLAKSI